MTIQECLETTDRELALIHGLALSRDLPRGTAHENQGRTRGNPTGPKPCRRA